MRILTCIGDATSIGAHGGLPYHLLEAGRRAGFLDGGWKLAPEALGFSRLRWNAGRLLLRGEFGGYQYSEDFLEALVDQVPSVWPSPDEIVSIFPLWPPHRSYGANISFYIDATLKENFEDYRIGEKVGRSIIVEALKREHQAYRDAARIICMSKQTARVVVESYGIDSRKVHIVPGGANILGAAGRPYEASASLPLARVRLGFVGKDWRRKNLAFVLEVADTLNTRGIEAIVLAAGFDPKSGPKHPSLKSLGFIDKRTQIDVFADFLRSCHFGCLFSHAEAFGLSNRESLRLGVPVLASNVGGIPDTVPEGCGHLFSPNANAAEVADVVEVYARNPDRYWLLRDAVGRRSHEFTWDAAVEKMQDIWSGSTAHCYQQDAVCHA